MKTPPSMSYTPARLAAARCLVAAEARARSAHLPTEHETLTQQPPLRLRASRDAAKETLSLHRACQCLRHFEGPLKGRF